MRISFVIVGNQENPNGNPIPYHRATQGSRWNHASQRYEAWKAHVQLALMGAVKRGRSEMEKTIYRRICSGSKPIIKTDQKQRTDIFIYWANHAHADPDNILKGINDALYESDKFVSCSADFVQSSDGRGRVTVILTL